MDLKIFILLLASLIIGLASGQAYNDDCFHTNELQFLYPMVDYSGNFTSVREYWLRRQSSCYFLQDMESKISWYSTDIDVYYQRFFDEEDGQGCRGETSDWGFPVFHPYLRGKIMQMGKNEEDLTDGRITCMFKYKFENKNTIHDLRLQVWNQEPNSAVVLSFKLISVVIAGLLIYTTV